MKEQGPLYWVLKNEGGWVHAQDTMDKWAKIKIVEVKELEEMGFFAVEARDTAGRFGAPE